MPWRVSTSPRSISVVIERLKALLPLEGLDWNEKSKVLTGFTEKKSGRPLTVYPVRRQFLLHVYGLEDFSDAYSDEQSFLAAGHDDSDIEARARMALDVFREYGLATLAPDGKVFITEAGRAVAESDTPAELMLAQLMKFSQVDRATKRRIFPLQVLARASTLLDALSIEELGVLTLCDSPEDVARFAVPAIERYRVDLHAFSAAVDRSKQTTGQKHALLLTRCVEQNDGVQGLNTTTVFRDYPDSVARLMQFTGLWSWKGVGPHKKLRVSAGHLEKVRLLANHSFGVPDSLSETDPSAFHYITDWLGRLGKVDLPWAQPDKLREVLRDRIGALLATATLPAEKLTELTAIAALMDRTTSTQELAVLEASFRGSVLPLVKQHYTEIVSKTDTERREILELLQRIESDQQENRALWLEAATWRALSSLDGAPLIQHGCRFDENLNPLSFGPGGAGSPDMYAACGPQVLVAEVTMLRNNDQWVKEGASVIDHVQTLMARFSEQEVVGVFVCPAVYYRTLWQFYILARESWLGRPIPVVPLTLSQFRSLLLRAYENSHTFEKVTMQLGGLAKKARDFASYDQWQSHLVTELPHS